jgi:gliding motility-associated-like protein
MGNGDTLRAGSIAYQYKDPGQYTIRVISNPKAPCSTSDEIVLNYPLVDENARRIPNAFSPNGDGTNDVFKIYFGNTQCKINSFQIYNRWGQLMFDSNRDNGFEWDGKYNGVVCSEGIYVYVIEGDGFSDKGWFALTK